MRRVRGWWRLLRYWFAARQTLVKHVAALNSQLEDVQREADERVTGLGRELDMVRRLHAIRDTEHRQTVAGLDAECESWKSKVVAGQADLRRERALSNAAWQRLGRVGLLADHPDIPAHLAVLLRKHTARTEPIEVVIDAR